MARLRTALRERWHIAAIVALLLGASVAGVVKATASDGAAPTQAYSVTDLGTLGGSFAFAFAVNNRSQATGVSTVPGDVVVHGFLWQSGAMTDLGTLGGSFVQANSINDRTQIVGIATLPGDQNVHAFLWQNGVMTDLGTLGGTDSQAWWINNAGQVAGDSMTANGEDHAFLWDHGVMTDLGTLGGARSVAFGIDDTGRVVGASAISDARSCGPGDPSTFAGCHAFQSDHGVITDLGTLGGRWSVANPSNNRGDVIGFSSLPGDAHYAAFRESYGTMRPLLPVAGDPNSAANGANDRGQVVGASGDEIFDVSPNRAVLWQDSAGTDLNSVIPANSPLYLLWAFGINETGQIVGQGVTADGSAHPFLLTPTGNGAAGTGRSSIHGLRATMPAAMQRALHHRAPGH
jgi:probable HAF family extracellular repeat protein